MSSSGHPATSTTTEVRFGPHGRGFSGHVVAGDSRRVVVAAPLSAPAVDPAPRIGERAELVWVDATALLALPVELAAVQQAILPLWHFRAVGPATSGQRRAAVRVPLRLPVQLRSPDGHVAGHTLDLSEGGALCVVQPGRLDPAVGDVLRATLHLSADHHALEVRADVLRHRRRGDGGLQVVIAFAGLEDADQDRLRRRVFLELRNRRAQGLT